jgi:capsular exopolysaccharide synthesis family protein
VNIRAAEGPMQEQRVAAILWRGKWLIALSLVLSVAVAVFITEESKKVYAATAILQVNSPGSIRSSITDAFNQLQANNQLAQTYATLIPDRSFLKKIQPKVANGRYTLSQLESAVSSSAVKNTALVKLQTTGSTPAEAAALAAGVANAFLRAVSQDSALRSSAQSQAIEADIRQISNEIQKGGVSEEQLASLRLARAALTDQLAQLVASNIAQGGSVTLSAPPSASGSPIRPRPVLNVLAGTLLGLLLGILLAWLRSRLDRGLHSADEAEELLEAPVLATIPLRKQYMPDDPVVSEAYDVLRANLAFISLDQALQVVTFTSYNPGEGKTATVEGLAYAAVRGGMSVCMVDGDIRTASLSTIMGARSRPGLTGVAVGTTTLDEAIVDLEPGLSLLPAGATPPNPPSLLASGRMREMMAELRERFSLVLVDSPPVAHLADASILAGGSDAVVLIARVGLTARADLSTALANLRHTPTPIVGSVLLRPQLIDETYYPVSTDGRPVVRESLLRS